LLQVTHGLSGILGVALGRFTECEDPERGHTAEQTLRAVLGPCGLPVVMGLPVGHTPPNLALPHGAVCALDAGAGALTILEEAARA
jgi:muramoyltetrapeptide carboxypeptidase